MTKEHELQDWKCPLSNQIVDKSRYTEDALFQALQLLRNFFNPESF